MNRQVWSSLFSDGQPGKSYVIAGSQIKPLRIISEHAEDCLNLIIPPGPSKSLKRSLGVVPLLVIISL